MDRFSSSPARRDVWSMSLLGGTLQTRPRLARKQNIASKVGPTLQDAFFFPTRSIREASARQHQVGLRKLLYASCTVQVALRKLLRASCSGKLVPASGSLQVALCKLRSLQVALCKLLCASCSVQVALRKLLCASCSRQGALRKLVGASWSAQVALCNLLCASCSAQVALKCKLHLATPARGPRRNRTRDPPVPGAGGNSRGPVRKKPRVFAPPPRRFPQRVARAEGCAGTAEIAKSHGFLHLDHADPRRGLRVHRRNRKTPRVFAPRPRRSPQRVARSSQKSQNTSSFCTSTTPIPAEGRAACWKSQKTMGFCTSTTPIPAEGRAGMLEIGKNHGFLNLDHADPRRGSIFV